MDIYAFGPVAGILGAAYSFVSLLGSVLAPVFGASSAVAAVILLTLAVRAVLIPVGVSQVKAEFTRRRVAPKLAELERRYGHDRALLQAKTMELYRQEKASPFAGCLPLVAQAPVISLIYALFLHATIDGHPNALLAGRLAGVPLGASFLHQVGAAAAGWPGSLVFIIVLALIAGVALTSRRVLAVASAAAPAAVEPAAVAPPTVAPASATQATIARIVSFLPLVTVVFAASVPLAAALYLLTSSSWTVVERLILRRMLDPGRHSGPNERMTT